MSEGFKNEIREYMSKEAYEDIKNWTNTDCKLDKDGELRWSCWSFYFSGKYSPMFMSDIHRTEVPYDIYAILHKNRNYTLTQKMGNMVRMSCLKREILEQYLSLFYHNSENKEKLEEYKKKYKNIYLTKTDVV